jgi:endonuclease/exonuclease/phosphatase family metal-dependent hydrolase
MRITGWRLAAFLLLTSPWATPVAKEQSIRFASFNVSLHFGHRGELAEKLDGGQWPAARKLAAIIQKTAPDVLLLNEFDGDDNGAGLKIFLRQYLAVSQYDQSPIEYAHQFSDVVNTGVLASMDFNGDGKITLPEDAYGFGRYPGQYGMAVVSRLPIATEEVRAFSRFLWQDMPDALWPVDPQSGEHYYSEEIRSVFRLSSKSHWDIPVMTPDGGSIHFLVSHPTPPVFDGPEDRNGRRNHDEIRFWADYVNKADYFYDDQGNRGGLKGDHFVIAGDLNADPNDGASRNHAARLLTTHPGINGSSTPCSLGALEQAKVQGGANQTQVGNPAHDTGDFDDQYAGNLRIDYVLPSKALDITASGVFWPVAADPDAAWLDASDHHLVWIDVRL